MSVVSIITTDILLLCVQHIIVFSMLIVLQRIAREMEETETATSFTEVLRGESSFSAVAGCSRRKVSKRYFKETD